MGTIKERDERIAAEGKATYEYPGVDMPEENDVILNRQVNFEILRDNVKLDRARLEQNDELSRRQVRAAALQVAEKNTEAGDVVALLTTAKAIEDFMISGTVPEVP